MKSTQKMFWGTALFLAALSVCFGQAKENRSFPAGPVRPLSEILNPDGTLRFEKGINGSFDPKEFRMITGPGGEPRFVPVSAAASSGTQTGIKAASGEGYWDNRFFRRGTNGPVYALAVSGSDIYVGGRFTTAGTVPANAIAKWNGTSWSALGSGMNRGGGWDPSVSDLALSGTDVYAGGAFDTAGGVTVNNVAKWDGTSWSALGTGMSGGPFQGVEALAANGTNIYAGGAFTTAGGVTVSSIAKWNGTTWSALGTGLNGSVRALAVSGNNIYAGGAFTTAGGVTVNNIAKWDGATWSALGTGMNTNGYVNALAVIGTDLYAGGSFTTAGGVTVNNIAKWDGTSWSALGTGMSANQFVYALAISGTDIYAGGDFTTAGGVAANKIAKWNGTSWSALGTGMSGVDVLTNSPPYVEELALSGSDIYAGGRFATAGGARADFIAKWNGSAWTATADTGQGLSSSVKAFLASGTDLYAGGWFKIAGGVTAEYIAKWNGTAWSSVGPSLNFPINALAMIGSDLYAGFELSDSWGSSGNCIKKWNGSAWSILGSGVVGNIYALAVIGTNLYAGGNFTSAGGVAANHIARWDGTSWSALGTGMSGGSTPYVYALTASGTEIYAGGSFTTAGGVAANYIAKWNGTSWSALGTGMNGGVSTLAVNGTDVYAGGSFTTAGGVAANYIARWNGTSWSAMGTGMNSSVRALAVRGTNIYAGGSFTTAGGVTANNIAKWNGATWSALGTGMNTGSSVLAMAVNGNDVYAGGYFSTAGGIVSNHFAVWHHNLQLTAPNGGETWQVGTSHDITWSTTGPITNVKLEYSTNNGSSWTTITGSIANSGSYTWTVPNAPSTNCLVRISDVANASTNDVSDAIFTITSAQPPIINLSRKALNFGAIAGGVATSGQTVIIGKSGGGTLNWSAASNQTWLGVTPASGTGTGIIQVSVNPAGLSTGLTAGAYQGTITVTDPSAANSPQTIAVALTVKSPGTGAVPFGDFATPFEGTTGITGAIPVTGWVLDDVEVTQVEVKRDPHASDPGGAIGPDGLVFIGYGLFVEGARPDVETGYSGYPLNCRAGWGYMLLTNFLPAQGNGTYKLHAYATDKEGNKVLLGSKTITCSNGTAVKPFGTIDTPMQGGDASGNPFLNFGWVLTPLPKTVAKDGSAIDVFVDSVKVGNLATAPNVYNQYREDVARAFPGLNNSSGPVGAFFLDTTKLTNGVHTIFWIATDDAGQADGIGSRYFNIVNTGGAAEKAGDTYSLHATDVPEARAYASLRHREERSDVAIPTMVSLSNLPLSFDPILVNRGFSLSAPPETMIPDNLGNIRVEMREVELLGISFYSDKPPFRKGGEGFRYSGFMIVGDELRPLPIGSTLDPSSGRFSWMPGPGFLGTYEMVFIKEDDLGFTKRIPIRVTIMPKFKN